MHFTKKHWINSKGQFNSNSQFLSFLWCMRASKHFRHGISKYLNAKTLVWTQKRL